MALTPADIDRVALPAIPLSDPDHRKRVSHFFARHLKVRVDFRMHWQAVSRGGSCVWINPLWEGPRWPAIMLRELAALHFRVWHRCTDDPAGVELAAWAIARGLRVDPAGLCPVAVDDGAMVRDVAEYYLAWWEVSR